MKTLKFLFLLLSAVAAAPATADLTISVNGGNVATQPIALVPFGGVQAPVDIAQVVDDDLVRSGVFRTMARKDMLEKPSDPSKLDFRNWRAVNMDNVVIGQIRQEGTTYGIRFYLFDVYRGEQLLGFDIPGVARDQLRHAAHRIADQIYERLTGVPGAFDTQIAYVTVSGYGDARRWQLITADSDGESTHVVASSNEPLMSPAWSPDRQRLAYVGYERGRSAIFLHTLASGELRKFVFEKGINGAPAWSPDGRQLVVTLSYGANPNLYLFDTVTGARRQLTATTNGVINTEAAWSPDGQSVVFTSDRGGSAQVYRLNIAGGDVQRLTFEGKQNLNARYSPDGKSLVLINYDGSRYRVGLFDLATSQLRLVSDGPLDESPSFAPNGVTIIYTAGAALQTVTTDGRIRQSLRQAGSEVIDPAWSPYIR